MRHCGILQISVLSAVLVEQTTWDPAHLHWSFTFVCVYVCWRWLFCRSVLPLDVLLYSLITHNSMWPIPGGKVCLCGCTNLNLHCCQNLWIIRKPRGSSVPREISRAHCQRRPGGILWTLIKRSKRGSKFNTGKLKRDKRKAQLIK